MPDDESAPPRIVAASVDWERGTHTLLLSNGESVSGSFVSNHSLPNPLAKTVVSFEAPVLVGVTTNGDGFQLDLPHTDNRAPIHGRPTIYLDQNHWRTMSQMMQGIVDTHPAEELQAARWLASLAAKGEVLIPVSSGHLTESGAWGRTVGRYHLGLAMLRVSRGWKMRDPLDVRRLELGIALTDFAHGVPLLMPPVITLESGALHAARDLEPHQTPDDFPPDLRFAHEAVTDASVLAATLLDPDQVPTDAQVGWATEMKQFAEFLAANPGGRELGRKRTDAKFFADLWLEMPVEASACRLSPEQMSDWFWNRFDEDIRRSPSLGLFREVLHDRLIDPNVKWSTNDLFDMMYNCCAAGYADHVVTDKSMCAKLQQGAKRLGRDLSIHSKLSSLVDTLLPSVDWRRVFA